MPCFQDEKHYLSPHRTFIGNEAEIAGIIRVHVRDCWHLLRPIRRGEKLLTYKKYGADSLQSLHAQVQQDGYDLTYKCPCLRKAGVSFASGDVQASNVGRDETLEAHDAG
jgi:hypothetical protein